MGKLMVSLKNHINFFSENTEKCKSEEFTLQLPQRAGSQLNGNENSLLS